MPTLIKPCVGRHTGRGSNTVCLIVMRVALMRMTVPGMVKLGSRS